MYNRNIREAIKHMELLQEQLESLEKQNEKLQQQLSTAICLLCSNKASVVKGWPYDEAVDGNELYMLHVESLDGNKSGTFSPEDSPYRAVLTGIDEYIEYMKENTDVNT